MTDYTLIILLTLFGFLALAAMLLVPVYRFLRREEQASRKWTEDEIMRRAERPRSNGRPRVVRGDDPSATEEIDPSREDVD